MIVRGGDIVGTRLGPAWSLANITSNIGYMPYRTMLGLCSVQNS